MGTVVSVYVLLLIMASLSTARDRYNAANSLLCLLQALEGTVTVVELRNEIAVKGLILQVDGFMNVTLKDVTVQGNDGSLYTFDDFFVKARNISTSKFQKTWTLPRQFPT